MRRFLGERGLEDALLPARPASRLRHLLRGGELVRVPSSPLALLSTPLLSARGKQVFTNPLLQRLGL